MPATRESSGDFREGVEAFGAKRKPRFRGNDAWRSLVAVEDRRLAFLDDVLGPAHRCGGVLVDHLANDQPVEEPPNRGEMIPLAQRSLERDLFNAKWRTGLCLAALSWRGPFPTIPQWKCPIVPCPSKVTLSNATSPMSIKKGSSPVRGLWSKPRPFVVTSKLSMPIICYDRRSPIFHLAVS
jgi:hypothetical protein